jgi:hypothetical protein
MKNELKFDSEMCKKMDEVEKMLWVIMDSNEKGLMSIEEEVKFENWIDGLKEMIG